MPVTNSLKTYAIQIGQSATDTQNFQLSANNDGTGKLARKSDGTGGDILSWDANGKLTLAATPVVTAVQSMIRLVSPNGYGSTNTVIPRFLTTVASQGTDITYADSATLGNSFTINANGVYAFTFHHNPSTASTIGISLNSTQQTTILGSIAVADILVASTIDNGTNTRAVSWIGYLSAGSVIRAHTAGYSAGVATFTAVRVS